MILAMLVHVLVLEDVFDTGLASVLDTLGTANELAETAGLSSAPFTIRIVALRRAVCTHLGLKVPGVSVARLDRPDAVVVPALGCKTPETLRAALQRRDVAEAVQVLRRWSAQGALVSAACTGTFVLAATSLLDGLRATTSWW